MDRGKQHMVSFPLNLFTIVFLLYCRWSWCPWKWCWVVMLWQFR